MSSETKARIPPPKRPTEFQIKIAVLENLYTVLQTSEGIQEAVREQKNVWKVGTSPEGEVNPVCGIDREVDAIFSAHPNFLPRQREFPEKENLALPEGGQQVGFFAERFHAAALQGGFADWSTRDQVLMTGAVYKAELQTQTMTEPYRRFLSEKQKDLQDRAAVLRRQDENDKADSLDSERLAVGHEYSDVERTRKTYAEQVIRSLMKAPPVPDGEDAPEGVYGKKPSPFFGNGDRIEARMGFLNAIQEEIEKLRVAERAEAASSRAPKTKSAMASKAKTVASSPVQPSEVIPKKPTAFQIQIAVLKSLHATLQTSAGIQKAVKDLGNLNIQQPGKNAESSGIDAAVDTLLSAEPTSTWWSKYIRNPDIPPPDLNQTLADGRAIRLFGRMHGEAMDGHFTHWSTRDQVLMGSAVHMARDKIVEMSNERIAFVKGQVRGGNYDYDNRVEMREYTEYGVVAIQSVMKEQRSPFTGTGEGIAVKPEFLNSIQTKIEELELAQAQTAMAEAQTAMLRTQAVMAQAQNIRGQKYINRGWVAVGFGVGIAVLTGALVFTSVINLTAGAATMKIGLLGLPALGGFILPVGLAVAVALLAVALITIASGFISVTKGVNEQAQAASMRRLSRIETRPVASAAPRSAPASLVSTDSATLADAREKALAAESKTSNSLSASGLATSMGVASPAPSAAANGAAQSQDTKATADSAAFTALSVPTHASSFAPHAPPPAAPSPSPAAAAEDSSVRVDANATVAAAL